MLRKLLFFQKQQCQKEDVDILIAGGGIAGSALFRYFTEAGKQTTLINYDRGSSWRNIGGGRPAFSHPDISDIANHNLEIFKEIQKITISISNPLVM